MGRARVGQARSRAYVYHMCGRLRLALGLTVNPDRPVRMARRYL